ncbi:MAG: glycosyltransferase [Nanoarchaeota archaeon]|nr:glycosyltransferase [Nanoarchaeota archaeon]
MISYIPYFLSTIYLMFIYSLILARKEINYKPYYQPVSVIVPCYNEDQKYLKECIGSILNAEGEKQIILVNNNSNKLETLEAIKELKKNSEVLVLSEGRQGKRFAHSRGLKAAKHELVVFVDSDTFIHKKAILEIIKPFQNPNIGAVASQVKLANREANFLTKCLSAMFWTSSNVLRKATSGMGMMQVIAGAMSCYRKNLLLALEPDYLSQTFCNRPCAISDDRYLTQRVQTRFGKKVEYMGSAICYTYMPETYVQAWRMIERWRRGVLREVFLIWKEPKKNAKFLFFDIQFNFVILILSVILQTVFIINLIINFSLLSLLWTTFWIFLTSAMWGSLMLMENPREFYYKFWYSVIYNFFFIFTFFAAIVNIRKQSAWSTR